MVTENLVVLHAALVLRALFSDIIAAGTKIEPVLPMI